MACATDVRATSLSRRVREGPGVMDTIDNGLMVVLVRVPFLSLVNAALLLGAPPATVARAAARLCTAGLVERVPIGRDKTFLYCLTDDGVIAVAQAHRFDPATLATAYDLGRRALLARVPALDRALDAQNTFVPLIGALASARGGALRDYRLGPLRWAYGDAEPLTLDGQLTLELAWGHCHVGLLWDGDADVPVAVLHERLRRLRALDERFPAPPVLLVTSGERRIPWPYPAGVLWTTEEALWAADRAEAGAQEPLAVRWVLPTRFVPGLDARRPQVRPLLDALAALPRMGMADTPLRTTPRCVRPGRRLGLEARLRALRHRTVERTPTPPGLLALALPPRALAALTVVGRHPLLRAPQIAEVCACPQARMRATLALLAAHDLVAPQECGDERTGRCVLTERGLRLLAARAGLPAAVYREAYGVLEDRALGVRHGLDFAAANLAHTTALQEVYLTFLRAARARRARLDWRGEWACTRTFAWDDEGYLLRPDAEAVYDDGQHRLRIFVELDRSTAPQGDIAAQLRRYHRFAQSLADPAPGGASRGAGRPRVLVAFVTVKSEERARNIVKVGEAVLAAERRPVLDVRATSLKRLLRRGPLERIWRQAGQVGLTSLLPEAPPARPNILRTEISGVRNDGSAVFAAGSGAGWAGAPVEGAEIRTP